MSSAEIRIKGENYFEVNEVMLGRGCVYFFPDQNSLFKKSQKYLKKFGYKHVLGVLFIGTDYSNQKPFGHYIQLDLKMMINMM